MKVKLLKNIRKRAFIDRKNSKYRAVIKSGFSKSGLTCGWRDSKELAVSDLRYNILLLANSEYERKSISNFDFIVNELDTTETQIGYTAKINEIGEELIIRTGLNRGQRVWFVYENELHTGICEFIDIANRKQTYPSKIEITVAFEKGYVHVYADDLWIDKTAFVDHFNKQIEKLNSFGKTKERGANITTTNHEC